MILTRGARRRLSLSRVSAISRVWRLHSASEPAGSPLGARSSSSTSKGGSDGQEAKKEEVLGGKIYSPEIDPFLKLPEKEQKEIKKDIERLGRDFYARAGGLASGAVALALLVVMYNKFF